LPIVGHAEGLPDTPKEPVRVLTDDEKNRAAHLVQIVAEYELIMIKLRSARFKQIAGKKRGWAIRKFLLGDPKNDRLSESKNRETAEKLEADTANANTGRISEDTPEVGSKEDAPVTPDHRGDGIVRESSSEEQSNG